MYNKNYSYPDIWRWDKRVWENRYCAVFGLYRHIEYLNYEKFRLPAGKGPYTGRTDGILETKTFTYRYADVEKEMETKGFKFKCYSMGGVKWMPVTPLDTHGKITKLLVVQVSVDYSDPNLAMDVLYHYKSTVDMAVAHDFALVFIMPGHPDQDNLFSSILVEFGSIFRVDLDQVYLDIDNLYAAGQNIAAVSGFTCLDDGGQPVPNPDALTVDYDGVKMLCITDRWQHKVSNLWGTATAVRSVHQTFRLDEHIHSICGKKMAEEMMIEERYEDADDPELLLYWESIGIRYESHISNGQRWISMVPLCAYGQRQEKLPVMVVFREVSRNNNYLPLVAIGGFWDYVDLAAQGEMNLIFFAMETPEDNEILLDILKDAARLFPMDLSRLYLSGHSHNAVYVMKFLARHPKLVAGVSTQGYQHCMNSPASIGEHAITDEEMEQLRKYDIPMISVCGTAENFFLINEPGSKAYEDSLEGYRRRLYCCNCPDKDVETIRAALTGSSYSNRRLGIPTDRAEVEVIFGRECYVGDVLNNDGKSHLRFVTVDNLPHITTPMTPVLSWSFLRRFARDTVTGELIELY